MKKTAPEKRQAEQQEIEKEKPDDAADDTADDAAPDTAIELDAWIESIGLDNEEDYNCYIYRIVKGYRKGAKTYCHKFKNETPDLDQIAERFGPGLYEICITRRIRGKWTPKKYTIEIDPAACPGAGAPAGQGAQSGGSVQVGLDIVRQVMQIMQPILDVSAQVKAAAPAPLSGADGLKPITAAFSDMMAEIIKIQSKATQEIITMNNARMIEQAEGAGDGADDGTDETPDFTEQLSGIVDMVKKGYALLTSPAGAGVIESTKAKPEFQALASDPAKKGAITKALIKEIGKVKAGKVLELFGITA